MSRIGKLPVNLPKGVTVSISDANVVSVKGPLGELKQSVSKDLKVEVVDNTIVLERPSESKNHKSLHGLYRALLANTLTSMDKQLIGHVAAKIRSLRPPEPYKGKGIKFVGEQLRRKAGKSASV
jgi:ribosomal protein L6P/L9E